jgi:hypothetical protein
LLTFCCFQQKKKTCSNFFFAVILFFCCFAVLLFCCFVEHKQKKNYTGVGILTNFPFAPDQMVVDTRARAAPIVGNARARAQATT